MARIIDVSTDSFGRPNITPTMQLLQNNSAEEVSSIVKNLIGSSYDPTVVYILWGMAITSGGTRCSAGAVFFNGEVYQCAGFSGTITVGQVIIANLSTTYTDPSGGTTFVDGVARNVHVNRTCGLAAGTSGTGTFNGGASAGNDVANFVPAKLQGSIATETAINTFTFTFTNNATFIFSTTASSGDGYVFDFTNAKIGAEVTIFVPISGVSSFIRTSGGAFTLLPLTSTALSGHTHATMVYKYKGNISGTDYASEFVFGS